MVKELVETIIKKMVAKPERVAVLVVRAGNKRTLEISVDEGDRGRVIGKQGQTIKALRALISAVVPEGHVIDINLV
jgi:predicted RNA-binding protein YlqC (UPF0109 family)